MLVIGVRGEECEVCSSDRFSEGEGLENTTVHFAHK